MESQHNDKPVKSINLVFVYHLDKGFSSSGESSRHSIRIGISTMRYGCETLEQWQFMELQQWGWWDESEREGERRGSWWKATPKTRNDTRIWISLNGKANVGQWVYEEQRPKRTVLIRYYIPHESHLLKAQEWRKLWMWLLTSGVLLCFCSFSNIILCQSGKLSLISEDDICLTTNPKQEGVVWYLKLFLEHVPQMLLCKGLRMIRGTHLQWRTQV